MAEKSRDGEVRCLNCFARFRPRSHADRAACPQCSAEWRISWPYPKTAKISNAWKRMPKNLSICLKELNISKKRQRCWTY